MELKDALGMAGISMEAASHFDCLSDIDGQSDSDLRAIGLTAKQITMVRAMIEAARSTPRKQKPILSSSRAVNEYIGTRFNAEQREHFMVLAVNARNKLLHEFEVAIGCLTGCLVHPREVFRPAVRVAAAAVILVHNHPSGDPTPSPEDVQLTDRLSEAGRILGIRVLDHVVVATDGYCSVMNGR